MSGPAYSGGVTDHHSLLCVFMSCPGPHALSVYPSPVTLSEPLRASHPPPPEGGSRRLPLNAPAPTPAPPRELGRGDAARPEPAAPRRADAPYSAAEQCGRQRPRWSRRSRHVTVINARVTSPRSPSVTSSRSRQSRYRALRESRHVAHGHPACLSHEARSSGVRAWARSRPVCLAALPRRPRPGACCRRTDTPCRRPLQGNARAPHSTHGGGGRLGGRWSRRSWQAAVTLYGGVRSCGPRIRLHGRHASTALRAAAPVGLSGCSVGPSLRFRRARLATPVRHKAERCATASCGAGAASCGRWVPC